MSDPYTVDPDSYLYLPASLRIEDEEKSDPTLPYTSYAENLSPKRLPPARKNLAKNPSVHGTLSGHYAVNNASGNVDPDVAWVGDSSLRFEVLVASSATYWYTPTTISGKQIEVVGGTEYSFAVRAVASPDNPDRSVRMEVNWRNSAGAAVGSTYLGAYVKATTSGWTLLRIDGQTAPATAVYCYVVVRINNLADSALASVAMSAGDRFWFDGLDVHEGSQYDGVYVDGDQPACSWDGTAHESTSTRTVPVDRELPRSEQAPYGRFYRGFGGSVKISCRVFRCDIENRRKEDISEAFISGSVKASEENEGAMWSFTGEFTDPIDLEPYVDFVAPFLRLEYANGKIVDGGGGLGVQMGLFVVVPPSKTITSKETRYTMDGRDTLWMLNRRRYKSVETEGIGVTITDRVVARLEALGFPRHVITRSARTTGRKRTYDISVPGTEVVNDLLKAISFYGITPDRFGRLTSSPVLDLMRREPNAILLGGEDGAVLEPYDVQPETEIYNHVVVHKDDKDTPWRYSIENNDPQSPTRIDRIGRHSLPPVSFSEAESQADVEAEARRLLQEKSSVMLTTTLRTMPQPWHNLREIYYLHLKQRSGATVHEAYGRYWCKGWQIDFDQRDATMVHALSKLTAFSTDV